MAPAPSSAKAAGHTQRDVAASETRRAAGPAPPRRASGRAWSPPASGRRLRRLQRLGARAGRSVGAGMRLGYGAGRAGTAAWGSGTWGGRGRARRGGGRRTARRRARARHEGRQGRHLHRRRPGGGRRGSVGSPKVGSPDWLGGRRPHLRAGPGDEQHQRAAADQRDSRRRATMTGERTTDPPRWDRSGPAARQALNGSDRGHARGRGPQHRRNRAVRHRPPAASKARQLLR